MNWLWNEIEVTEADIPEDAHGFIYKIVHIPTGRFYIGKKSLSSRRRVKIGKRELALIREERRERGVSGRLPVKKLVIKASDWQEYYSSNNWIVGEVKEGRASDFKREIIQFCHSKKSLTYWEVYWQFHYDVLNNEMSLNDNIGGRFYRKDL
jgi:hypothetical protein